ncbi:carbonic anhydrase [Planctomycetota bacterium]
MSFCTVINCMDGRIQLPVIKYLQERFNVDYVDSITEPGPNLILAQQININLVESIFNRIKISVDHHGSVGIAVAGHYGCAGNPAPEEEQTVHTLDAIRCIKSRYSDLEIIGLWVDENWEVSELSI